MPRRCTRKRWAIEHTENNGVPDIRVTCRKCQWTIGYRIRQAEVHYNECPGRKGPEIEISAERDDSLRFLPNIHEPSLLLDPPNDSADSTFQLFVEEMNRLRRERLHWDAPIIAELTRTWKLFYNQYERWVEKVHLRVEKYREEGLAEEADKLAELLDQTRLLANPGEFQIMYQVGVGEEDVLLQFTGKNQHGRAGHDRSGDDDSESDSHGVPCGSGRDGRSSSHGSANDEPTGSITAKPPRSQSATPARTLPPRACRRQSVVPHTTRPKAEYGRKRKRASKSLSKYGSKKN
ncbi:hypothetical protein F5Y10DRAFT_228591 [Nemania abortiva]|nr:hypothetical protein F5Y10DRAFT_228591 [Nemania abortiva]